MREDAPLPSVLLRGSTTNIILLILTQTLDTWARPNLDYWPDHIAQQLRDLIIHQMLRVDPRGRGNIAFISQQLARLSNDYNRFVQSTAAKETEGLPGSSKTPKPDIHPQRAQPAGSERWKP